MLAGALLVWSLAPAPQSMSRTSTGSAAARPWMDGSQPPAVRAAELATRMTLAEKLILVQGDGSDDAHCVGHTPAIARFGIPELCLGDGAGGVSNGLRQVTQFPAPVALASTWDVDLAREYGAAQGMEQAGKGRNVVLAPTINILRTSKWGRAAETYGEDPYLTAALATSVVEGLQSRHVISMPKHFAANNQETDRFGEAPAFDAVDERIPERALREIYFPAFRAAVEDAHAGAVMCAYNRVNGRYACENPQLLGPLRREWHFKGFVTSDWFFGTRSTVAAANAGLDQSMPGGRSPFGLPAFFGRPLQQAIADGAVPRTRLDAMVRHILTSMFTLGLFERRSIGSAAADVRSEAHRRLAERVAADGTVLLQNDDQILPLGHGIRSIAVIGDDAGAGALTTETYGGFVGPDAGVKVVTPLEGIRARAPAGTQVVYARGTFGLAPLPALPAGLLTPLGRGSHGWLASYFKTTDLSGAPVTSRIVADIDGHAPPALTLPEGWSARWQAVFTPPATGVYRFSLTGGGTARLSIGGKPVAALVKEQFHGSGFGSVALQGGRPEPIAVSFETAPGILAPEMRLGWQGPDRSLMDEAVKAAGQAEVAIVFVGDACSEGADRMSLALPAGEDALITAVAKANRRTVVVLNSGGAVFMPWLGDVAAVLEAWYPGEEDGRAIADVLFGDVDPAGKLPETFPAGKQQGPATLPAEFPGVNGIARYDEGLLVGYRWYEAKGERPLFPFGYGLSYTNFSLSRLEITGNDHHGDVSLGLRVANIGGRSGAEVVQLYVSFPDGTGEPPRQLKEFRKITLRPGKAAEARFALSRRMLQIWSGKLSRWTTPPGRYTLSVGTSSRDLPLQVRIDVTKSH